MRLEREHYLRYRVSAQASHRLHLSFLRTRDCLSSIHHVPALTYKHLTRVRCATFLEEEIRHMSATDPVPSNVKEMQPAYSPYDDEIDLRKYLDILIAWWKEDLVARRGRCCGSRPRRLRSTRNRNAAI